MNVSIIECEDKGETKKVWTLVGDGQDEIIPLRKTESG